MFMARDKSESSFQLRKSMCLHVTASFLNVIFAEELLWSKPSKAWNVCEISETPSTILVLLGSAIHCIHLWNTWIISNYFVNFLAFFWHNFGTGEFSRSEAHRPENSNFQDVKTFPVVTPWQTLADTWWQGPRNKESKPQMEMNVVWIARIARIAAEDSTLKWGSRFGQFQFQPSPKSRTCNDMQMRRFFAKN